MSQCRRHRGGCVDPHELERCLTELQDIEAIKQRKAEYCDICDDAHNPDRIVEIFTEDAVWEGEGVATTRGHAELRRLFERFAQQVSFSQHNVFNPRIAVKGDTASGGWPRPTKRAGSRRRMRGSSRRNDVGDQVEHCVSAIGSSPDSRSSGVIDRPPSVRSDPRTPADRRCDRRPRSCGCRARLPAAGRTRRRAASPSG